MPQSNRDPTPTETDERIPARLRNSGSAANETVDGLDAHRGEPPDFSSC